MAKTAGRRRRTHRKRTHRGGTYTVNVAAAPAGGFPEIDSIRESACGAVDNRFGNNTFGGRRSRRKHKKTSKKTGRRRHRKTMKRGGAMSSSPNYPGLVYPTSDMALNVPRSGYGFVQGPGTAGLVDYQSIY